MSHRVEVEDEAEQVRTGLLLLSLNHTRESNQEVDQADQWLECTP